MPDTAPAFSANQSKFRYIYYNVTQYYEYDSGALAIPIAYALNALSVGAGVGAVGAVASRTSKELVQVSAPNSKRIVTFKAARLNAKPVVPGLKAKANEILLTSVLRPEAPKVWSDGSSRLYVISGSYVFEQLAYVAPTDANTITWGVTDVDAFDLPDFLDSYTFDDTQT